MARMLACAHAMAAFSEAHLCAVVLLDVLRAESVKAKTTTSAEFVTKGAIPTLRPASPSG